MKTIGRTKQSLLAVLLGFGLTGLGYGNIFTVVLTHWSGVGGVASVILPVSPSVPAQFYQLRAP